MERTKTKQITGKCLLELWLKFESTEIRFCRNLLKETDNLWRKDYFSFTLTWNIFLSPQKSSSITSKSCDPTLLSKENISYKNPYSSFLSKTTFWWMTGLFWKGFFKPLELTDLGNLHEKDTSRYQYDQFLFIFQSKVNGTKYGHNADIRADLYTIM